ncbi:hypothetical protein MXB_2360 [Myxobolus squamalis]|nr:hypothetical protein MXB_2360 [Myxobolus squamalis]
MHKLIDFLEENSKTFNLYINRSNINFDENSDHRLCPMGIRQMHLMGQRYRKRLGGILNLNSPSTNFNITSTCKSRAIHSMIAFVDGMFHIDENTREIPEIKTNPCEGDYLYRFFDFCQRYTSMQKCSKQYVIEEKIFEKTLLMKNIALRISEKLGLEKVHHLSPYQVKILYFLCAFDIINNDERSEKSPCSLFDEESLIAYDYLLDIKNFYKRANVNKLNIEISCKLFKKMFDYIVKAMDSCPRTCISKKDCDHTLKGEFAFAHAETLIPILGYLGLFGHEEGGFVIENKTLYINADNYHYLKDNRIFKGGFFAPMAGNILFAVGCPVSGIGESVVMTLLNEHPISLPCCRGKILEGNEKYPVCSKEQFIQCYADYAFNCDYFGACSEEFKCHS